MNAFYHVLGPAVTTTKLIRLLAFAENTFWWSWFIHKTPCYTKTACVQFHLVLAYDKPIGQCYRCVCASVRENNLWKLPQESTRPSEGAKVLEKDRHSMLFINHDNIQVKLLLVCQKGYNSTVQNKCLTKLFKTPQSQIINRKFNF